jgi:hypothetical protein
MLALQPLVPFSSQRSGCVCCKSGGEQYNSSSTLTCKMVDDLQQVHGPFHC